MMRKILCLGALSLLLVLAGCSNSDDLAKGGALSGSAVKTVVTSGVQTLPAVVTKGTTEVTVKYKSNGKDVALEVPFTQTATRDNSALVSGYIRLYSATPTEVDLYNGETCIGERIRLTGLQLSATPAAATSQTKDAYYFVTIDERIAGGQSFNGQDLTHFYPKDEKGDPGYGGSYGNVGQVQTTDAEWYTTTDGREYVYSRDGSATADLLKSIPESAILESLPVSQIRQDFSEKYKIIWYMVQQRKGMPRVFGYLTLKDTRLVPNDPLYVDRSLPATVDPDQPSTDKTEDGIYHDAGVMLYDKDGDKDYNDLVVDYDVEARFPKDGKSPYIKVAMHLRALSDKTLNTVGLKFDNLSRYVCPADDMHITFHGVKIEDTPQADIPDFRDCTLVPGQSGDLTLTGSNLQWLLNNNNKNGWYVLDGNGYYNETQSTFNGKPFATLSFMLYPKAGQSETDIEQAVADILSVTSKGFLFDGQSGDYIIAPVGTPHVAEGNTITTAFSGYPEGEWWKEFDGDKVVNINK